ncbi:MAG: HAMP domain-containing protein [Polyangiaceae bacterium]|nr:HAMP domain-containing protein [Polyangiaceae bacterium]
MLRRIADLWREARPLVRAEITASAWEIFSVVLFVAAIVPAALDTPWPPLLYLCGLVLTSALARYLRRGSGVATVLLRTALWMIAVVPLLPSTDARLLVGAAGFGLMGGTFRRAVHRRLLDTRAMLSVSDAVPGRRRLRRELRAHLSEAAAVAGIVGGHVMLLFAVAFLRTKSVVLFRGWFEVIPVLGVLGTVGFTLAVRPPTVGLLRALAAGPEGDPEQLARALRQARRLPHDLAIANFLVWVTCTSIGVFYFRPGPVRWNPGDALMQLGFGSLFAWGVSFYQRGSHEATLAPVVELFRRWRGEAEPPAAESVRRRMLRDFGLPLVFTLALSLFASLGLYRSLSTDRTIQEDLNAILALVASFLLLVLSVGGLFLRAARQLSRPLVELADAADEVAAGKLAREVPPVTGPAEIDRLGRSIERMRQALAQTIATLEAERQGLEARVVERTAELTHALEELKQAEAALVHNERMASIGELVAGVAHEIYNPLTAITGSVAALERIAEELRAIDAAHRAAEDRLPAADRDALLRERERLDVDGALADLAGVAKVVERASQRSVGIVASLKNFARAPHELVPTDLHEGLRETLALLAHRLKQGRVTLRERYGELPRVKCRGGELNQVFMNLLTNAVQALADRKDGVIEIATRAGASTVTVSVADNGPGVPPDLAPRIFEPFVTTKPRGEGTGLGLSICRDIVRRHGGSLRVEPAGGDLGSGARFVCELPIDPGAPAPVSERPG